MPRESKSSRSVWAAAPMPSCSRPWPAIPHAMSVNPPHKADSQGDPIFGTVWLLTGNPVLAFNLWCLSSYVLCGLAMHWMIERWELFDAYRIALPAFDIQLLTAAMRWLMLALLAILLVWLLRAPFERWLAGSASEIRDRRR